jgi:putative copper resistance protein D
MADTILILVRFVHFATAMLLCGASLFPVYAGVRPPERRAWRAGLAWGALLSWLAWLDADTVAISGDASAWDSAATIGKVLAHTQFGHIWQWRMGILAALALAASLDARRLVMPLAVLSIATLAGIGHGAMGVGDGVYIHLANQAIHMLSASVWVGGLAPLAVLVRRWPEDAVVSRALARFSLAGMAAVGLILATGTVNAYFLVGSFHALVSTPYGLVLCGKIAAVTVMVGLAAYNRLVLMPRLGHGRPIRAVLLRTVAAEQALALAAVALVSWLGTMMPAFGM